MGGLLTSRSYFFYAFVFRTEDDISNETRSCEIDNVQNPKFLSSDLRAVTSPLVPGKRTIDVSNIICLHYVEYYFI